MAFYVSFRRLPISVLIWCYFSQTKMWWEQHTALCFRPRSIIASWTLQGCIVVWYAIICSFWLYSYDFSIITQPNSAFILYLLDLHNFIFSGSSIWWWSCCWDLEPTCQRDDHPVPRGDSSRRVRWRQQTYAEGCSHQVSFFAIQ